MRMRSRRSLRSVRRSLFGKRASRIDEACRLEGEVLTHLVEGQRQLRSEFEQLREETVVSMLKFEQCSLRDDLARLNTTTKNLVRDEMRQVVEDYEAKTRATVSGLAGRVEAMGDRLSKIQAQTKAVEDVVGETLRKTQGKYISALSMCVELKDGLKREAAYLQGVRGKLRALAGPGGAT